MVFSSTSGSHPAITAYKVYHMSSVKLDREARRQTPDLGRLVAHATIIDNIRRWSRDAAVPTETVVVDSDPFEDSSSDEEVDSDNDVGEVAVFEFDAEDAHEWSGQSDATSKTYEITSEQNSKSKTIAEPKRRPPPPPKSSTIYNIKDQSWRQNRPITVQEIAIEVDADD